MPAPIARLSESGVEHGLAHARDDEQRDRHALGDDHAHRLGRREVLRRDEAARDRRVDAHARRERERIARVEPHRDGGDAGDERGHREHLFGG